MGAQVKPKREKKFVLWKEITAILIFKVIAIFTIWHVFFSDPLEKHLTVSKMQEQVFSKRS